MVGLILIGLVLIYTFVTQRTVLGRHIYAVGGNSNAARLSGVDTRRVSFFVMVNMGLLAGVAGMVFTAYLNAANPKDGTGFELDAIAAVFIGGAAVAGGVGKVSGAMIGGFVMGVLNLGLANLSVDSNWIQIIKGLVLLSAVAFDVMSKMRGKLHRDDDERLHEECRGHCGPVAGTSWRSGGSERSPERRLTSRRRRS